ncbi:MAG TPA: hypothetical protein VGB85_03475 [Nannocystis sp.]|jgi:hypothetical protein
MRLFHSILCVAALVTACNDEGGTGETAPLGTTGAPDNDTTGAPDNDTSGSSGEVETQACVKATVAVVNECQETFCPPVLLHLTVDNAGGAAGLVRQDWPIDAIGYRHNAPELRVDLTFAEALGDDTSDAARTTHFAELDLTFEFPTLGDSTPLGDSWTLRDFFGRIPDITDPAQFESFAITGGRLKATFHGELSSVQMTVYSDAEQCVDGDIAGRCDCTYDGFTLPVIVDLDLSIDD